MKKQKSISAVLCTVTTVYLFTMAALLPLVFDSTGFQDISTIKYKCALALGLGYIAAMAAVAVWGVLSGAIKPVSPLALLKNSTWPQRFALGYLLFTWVSACVSQYFPETVFGGNRHENAMMISIYVVSFLLISVYGRPDPRLLWAVGGSATAFSCVCFLQFAGLNPFSLYPEGMNYYDAGIKYSGQHLGTIGNADLAAAYLCIVIPVLWIALLHLSRKGNTICWLLVIPLACTVAVLVKMNVMAGLVGVLGGGFLSLPVVLPITPKAKKYLWISLGAVAAVGLLVLFFVDFGGTLHEAHELLHGNIDDSFGSGRVHIWREVISRIPEHFWFGAGPDTMLNAELESFSRYDEALDIYIVSYIDAAHNEPLNILFNQGVFALASYAAMLISGAIIWFRRSADNKAVAVLGGACLCYLVQGLFGISQPATAPLLWAALALLCSREHTAKSVQPAK